MGTVVSLDLRDEGVPPEAVDAVFTHLHDIDERFSTYRSDSEVSRLARGELDPSDTSPDVRHVLAVCEQLARDSGLEMYSELSDLPPNERLSQALARTQAPSFYRCKVGEFEVTVVNDGARAIPLLLQSWNRPSSTTPSASARVPRMVPSMRQREPSRVIS